ncbi:MAG: hypothetical protein RL634_284 [Bacteroidota bacterium]
MIDGGVKVVLDACVLYPAPLRDFLLNLAEQQLIKPYWTDEINEEWVRNLLIKRKDLTRDQLTTTVAYMNAAFPDANIVEYNADLPITISDKYDEHVVAAAIKARAHFILTLNLKDFPENEMKKLGIRAEHPDQFISTLIEIDSKSVITAFNNQVENLRYPKMRPEEVLQKLEKCNLSVTSNKLRKIF